MINNNNIARESAASGLSSVGGALDLRVPNTADIGGGSFRIHDLKHRAKAEAFWSGLSERRKMPGHCCRCGRPHAGKFRQCDPCRVRVAASKSKRIAKLHTLGDCIKMVVQCRREVTKLREIIKQMQRAQRSQYGRGYRAGQKQKAIANKYHDAYPNISKQELAEINHAYDHE